jgi:hypothetical protein
MLVQTTHKFKVLKTPNEKLAQSLRQLKALQDSRRRVIRTRDISS